MKIDPKYVAYDLIASQEIDVPVRGNACASGDNEFDRQIEQEILDRLAQGDMWAWCCVEVTATTIYKGEITSESDYLGCCSYEDQEDFINNSGLYEGMKAMALEALEEKIA